MQLALALGLLDFKTLVFDFFILYSYLNLRPGKCLVLLLKTDEDLLHACYVVMFKKLRLEKKILKVSPKNESMKFLN